MTKYSTTRNNLKSVSTSSHVLAKLSVSSQKLLLLIKRDFFSKILGTALQNGAHRLVPRPTLIINDQLGVQFRKAISATIIGQVLLSQRRLGLQMLLSMT